MSLLSTATQVQRVVLKYLAGPVFGLDGPQATATVRSVDFNFTTGRHDHIALRQIFSQLWSGANRKPPQDS